MAKKNGKTLTQKQMAAAKKKAVISSAAFQEWFVHRMSIHPVPSDPYRAYMIDLALQAGVLPKESWQYRVPRSDFPDIDLPELAPKMMPAHIPKFRGIPAAAKPREPHPFEQELEQHTQRFLQEKGLPPVRLYPETIGSVGAGTYWRGLPEIGMMPAIRVGIKNVPKKYKGKEYPTGWHPVAAQVLASLKHELGHHASAHGVNVSEAIFGKLETKKKLTERQKEEKKAWAIADPYLQEFRPVQKWRGRIMLGTYLGTTPPFSYE